MAVYVLHLQNLDYKKEKNPIYKHVLRILLYKRGNNLNIFFFFKFIYKVISGDLFSSPDILDDGSGPTFQRKSELVKILIDTWFRG